MKTASIVQNLFIVAIVAILSNACHADEKRDRAARFAVSWLTLVDAKEYKKSWEEAAPFFKDKVSEEDWDNMVSAVREPLGEVKSREFLGAQFATTLPGAPEGEYRVIQFKTHLGDKPDFLETITLMKDEEDIWRVSGYFIK